MSRRRRASTVDPQRKLLRGYPHMAIHPYPVELIGDVALARWRDRCTCGRSGPRTRSSSGHSSTACPSRRATTVSSTGMNELTPAMLARFTQVDYDRELALVAMLAATATEPRRSSASRAISRIRIGTSAEFAVVVADAWQRRGVARVLMRGLIVCAKRRGFERLAGTMLRANEPMLAFVRASASTLPTTPRIRRRSARRSRWRERAGRGAHALRARSQWLSRPSCSTSYGSTSASCLRSSRPARPIARDSGVPRASAASTTRIA